MVPSWYAPTYWPYVDTIHRQSKQPHTKRGRNLTVTFRLVFLKKAPCPLSRQGRPTGIRITGSVSSAPGRGFVRPPVCPTPPAICSSYRGASWGQLTDCWHQMSSYDQYILVLCCCILYHMSSRSGLVDAVLICLCLLLTKSCLVVEFGFLLCPFEVRWWPHSQSFDDEGFHWLVGIICMRGLD